MSSCWTCTIFGAAQASGSPLGQSPLRHVQHNRRQARPLTTAAKGKNADENAPDPKPNALSSAIKRKVRQVADVLVDIGEEIATDRLQSATRSPASPPHRLSRLIQEKIPYGKPVLVAEVCRPSPSSTSQDVAKLATDYVSWGVDAIAVPTDLEETPAGLSDLFAVCRAVQVPVLQWDWFVHPLQIAEAKEAGAAGIIGVIVNVLGKSVSPTMYQYAHAAGLDAPLEVVNKAEVTEMGDVGVLHFGINLSVGLSLALPGFQSDMAKGLLNNMPFGALTLVGAKSAQDAIQARVNGADAILLRKEMLTSKGKAQHEVQRTLEHVIYCMSGDD